MPGDPHLGALCGTRRPSQSFERVAGDGFVFLRTQDQSDRRILAVVRPVFPSVVQIQVHLTGVSVGELAKLQIDDHQTTQAPVEEQQINAIPLVTDAQPPLPSNEAEVAAQFQ